MNTVNSYYDNHMLDNGIIKILWQTNTLESFIVREMAKTRYIVGDYNDE